MYLFRNSLCHRCANYWKSIFMSPSNRKQQERLKHLPVVFQENFQKLKLEMSICFFIAGVFLDLIFLKQMLGEVPQRMSTDSAHASVLLSPGMVVSKHQYFLRVCLWPRKWHWKTEELENSTFFHCFVMGWNERFRWAWVKLCFAVWSQTALFCRKG